MPIKCHQNAGGLTSTSSCIFILLSLKFRGEDNLTWANSFRNFVESIYNVPKLCHNDPDVIHGLNCTVMLKNAERLKV